MAENMMVNGQGYSYKPNQNKCSHCKLRNLPEPIVFAKLCRLTSEYVCDGCYHLALEALIDAESRRG